MIITGMGAVGGESPSPKLQITNVSSVAARERGRALGSGAKRHAAAPRLALGAPCGCQSMGAGPNGEVVVASDEGHLAQRKKKLKYKFLTAPSILKCLLLVRGP